MVTHPLARLLRLLVAAAVGGLFLAGLFLHGVVAGVILLAVALGLAALSSRTWSGLHPRGRAARVLVLVLIVAVAAVKIRG